LQRLLACERLWKARRAKEDDGVLDALAAEAGQGFLIFGENAQAAAVRPVEKFLVLIGQRRAVTSRMFVLLSLSAMLCVVLR